MCSLYHPLYDLRNLYLPSGEHATLALCSSSPQQAHAAAKSNPRSCVRSFPCLEAWNLLWVSGCTTGRHKQPDNHSLHDRCSNMPTLYASSAKAQQL